LLCPQNPRTQNAKWDVFFVIAEAKQKKKISLEKEKQCTEHSVSFNSTSSEDDYLSDGADPSSFLQSQPKPIIDHSKARERQREKEDT